MLSRKFILTLTAVTLIVIFTSLVSFPFLNLSLDFSYYYPIILYCAFLYLVYSLYENRSKRISDTALCSFWGIIFTNVHIIPMFVIARLGKPLNDQILAQYDLSIGIEVPQILEIVNQHPFIKLFLALAYDSLIILLAMALILPPILGKTQRITNFFLSLIISTFAGFILFYLYQAEGPWIHYNYQPQINQDLFNSTYKNLRTSHSYIIDPGYSNGLICFPSFHTILAMLCAYALTSVPWVRWWAYLQSLFIILGTISTGTHYIIDVLTGILISILSIYISKFLLKMEPKYI